MHWNVQFWNLNVALWNPLPNFQRYSKVPIRNFLSKNCRICALRHKNNIYHTNENLKSHSNLNPQKIKRVEKSHSTFITGLEFLPTTPETDAIRGFSDASVVSISVDHQVCIHHIPRLNTISLMTASVMIFVFLILVFCLCSYLGL